MMRSLTNLLFLTLLMISGRGYGQQTTEPAPDPAPPGESQSESGAHFDHASELYALGPTKAKEILAELDLELRDHPQNVKALLLKAMTQMGIEQLDAALATLDQISEVESKTKTLYPNAVLLRARCLFYKGEYESAKRTLEPFWAFFQDDAESKCLYDDLMAAITAKTQKESQLPRIRLAAEIAFRQIRRTLAGYFAVHVELSDWQRLSNDSDLGMFLRPPRPEGVSAAVILLAPHASGAKLCIFFEGKVPVELLISSGAAEALQHLPITAALLEGPEKEAVSFEEGNLTTDDGQSLPTLRIVGEEAKTPQV